MPAAKPPDNEDFRLSELNRLDILDTDNEPFFEQVIDQVVACVGCSMAAISLVDKNRQWFKASRGLDVSETPRDDAFCAHTILAIDPMVVADAASDPRFVDNKLVCGAPHIGAYAGVPIVLESGVAIGTICALEAFPRQWPNEIIAGLERFALMIGAFLEARVSMARAHEEIALKRELSDTKARYESVVSSMVEGVVVLDPEGRILEANDAALDILRLTPDEITGMLTSDPSWQAIHEDGRPMQTEEMPAMRALATGQKVTDGTIGLGADASVSQWLSVNAVPLFDGDAAEPYAVVATFSDVTKRRQREVALSQARDDAEGIVRAKSAFLDTMAHEVRTPLNGMLGLMQHLQRFELPADVTSNLNLIQRSGMHLKSIVDDALDLSRMEAGDLALKPRSFDLAECLQDAAALAEAQAGARASDGMVTVVAEVSPTCSRQVVADPLRLNQVLHNLLSNAVKFTEQGQVVLRADLVADGAGKPHLLLEVEDTGQGVPQEFQAQLFDRFTRADSGIALKAPGAGLGLHLSRRIMQLMGGDVAFAPNQPHGSVFKVSMPVELDQTPFQLGPAKQGMPDKAMLPPGLRILLADDHAINRQVVAALMSPFQPEITLAGGGEEALELSRRQTFDVVLLDLRMPGVSGLDVIADLRTHEAAKGLARTPALCVTATDRPTATVSLLDAGFDGVVEKPVMAERLFAAIQEALERPEEDGWMAERQISEAS